MPKAKPEIDEKTRLLTALQTAADAIFDSICPVNKSKEEKENQLRDAWVTASDLLRKLQPRSKYPEIKADCELRFRVSLTDTEIEKYAADHPITKRELSRGVFDSLPRDLFAEAMVTDIMGKDYHWPLNGDSEQYTSYFYKNFFKLAKKKGIRVIE